MSDVYRQAASVLVLKPVEGGHQMLLLHKPRKKDSWQLPQGGMESGEDVTQAALRELHEEASLSGCTVLGVSKEIYQYDFPPSYRRFRPDNVKGQHISFVFALAPENPAVVVDGKEVDGYVWVGEAELPQYLKRKQYLELVRGLYEEARTTLTR